MWRILPSDRDPAEFFIHGGPSVDLRIFKKLLAASDLPKAVSLLPPGWIKHSAQKAVLSLNANERISSLETVMEREFIHHYSRPLNLDPLGAGFLLAYLLSLRREGIYLKLSLTRLLFGMPPEIFQEMAGHV
jgi:vacuolar-type H+-ATPase subunit C/Vma6